MRKALTIIATLVLAGCGGGGTDATTHASIPVAAPASPNLVPTSFTMVIPRTSSSTSRQPQYVTGNVASVVISLTQVNGGSPPSGLTNNPATSNISAGSCASGCTVNGPSVPPGSDTFTLTTFDGASGTGNIISNVTTTLSVVAGVNNTLSATLNGVPSSLVWGSAPSGAGGTSFSDTALSLAVKDADGNTITGTYAHPITLTDSDVSGATTLSATTLSSSSDANALSLSYTGLDIVPASIEAQATGTTPATLTFSPSVQPVIASTTEIDLYATGGTGSTGTLTAAQFGWTVPFGKSISASLDGCANIATISPASGTSFTVTVAASPAAGTCTLTLTGGAGATAAVTLTYTSIGFGVNAHSRKSN